MKNINGQEVIEVWKNVIGYQGFYTVSNFGRLFSIAGNKIKVPVITHRGYYETALYKSGDRKRHKVHRLVAEAFITNILSKPQVNHIDGNKLNNSVENLEWCTGKENTNHYHQKTKKGIAA